MPRWMSYHRRTSGIHTFYAASRVDFDATRDTRSKPICGTSMFKGVLVNPALLHPFYVIAIQWRVHTFQRTASVVQVNLQMTLAILTATRLWRTSENCRSIARNSTSNLHAVVYGRKAFKPRSWMSKRESPILDLWHDRGFSSTEACPACMGPTDPESTGTAASSMQSITASVVKFSFDGSNKASSYDPESFDGLRPTECSISIDDGSRPMG